MEKVRLVDAPDYGKLRSDKKYNWVTGGGPNYATVPLDDVIKAASWSAHYGGCLAAAKPLTLNYIQQHEVFESSENERPLFNDCYHSKIRTVNFPFTIWYIPTTVNTRAGYTRYGRIPDKVMSQVAAPEPDFSEISSNMQAEAYHSMLPRFEGDVSLVNFIFEMKDFRSLSNLFASTGASIWKGLGKNPSEITSAATKRLAEVHLIDNFALRPLASDLSAIVHQALKLVMDAQREFSDKGLITDQRHFSKTLNQEQSLTQSTTPLFGSYAYLGLKQGIKSSSKWTCTMEGNYGYTMRSDLDAFTKYWGLDISLESVWNGLPFSFLADYIIGIGHSLNVMRHDSNVQYRITQYSESMLNTRESGMYLTRGSTNVAARVIWVDETYHRIDNKDETYFVSGTASSKYRRVIKTPYWGPFLPPWKIPSGRQGLNMAALLRCLL